MRISRAHRNRQKKPLLTSEQRLSPGVLFESYEPLAHRPEAPAPDQTTVATPNPVGRPPLLRQPFLMLYPLNQARCRMARHLCVIAARRSAYTPDAAGRCSPPLRPPPCSRRPLPRRLGVALPCLCTTEHAKLLAPDASHLCRRAESREMRLPMVGVNIAMPLIQSSASTFSMLFAS